EASGLELDVLPITVRELVNPDRAGVIGSPGPGFLSRQFVMIGYVCDSPIGFFVVDTEVIASRVPREERECVRHPTIATEIDTVVLRKAEDRPEGMWISFSHRVYEAHVFSSVSRRCRPEPVAAGDLAPIVERDLSLDYLAGWSKPDGHGPLHALDTLGVPYDDYCASVFFHPCGVVNRRDRGQRVAIRKVPFDAPTGPGAPDAYERILDDMVRVEHVAF